MALRPRFGQPRPMRWATILRRALPALLLAALAGCSSPPSATGYKLTWRTLSRGLSSGLVEPGHFVIRDPTAYYKLWADHAAEVPRPALPPAVDFSQEMVLAVTLGNRPTGGYLVEIVDVTLHGRTAHVLIVQRSPRPGILQIQRPTQPYQFIALPVLNARVHFRYVDEDTARTGRRKARPGDEGLGLSSSSSSSSSAPPPPNPAPASRAPAQPIQSPRGATR